MRVFIVLLCVLAEAAAYPKLPPLPLLWDTAPALSAITKSSVGIPIVDPWNYTHRLTIYQVAMSSTSHCLWGSSNGTIDFPDAHPIWGLALQHGWQFWSGRLKIHSNTLIDDAAWWGCGNYFFSVIFYLGCEAAGICPKVQFKEPPSGPNPAYCTSEKNCLYSAQIQHWAEFFREIVATNGSCTATSRAVAGDPLMDRILSSYWSAHIQSIAGVLNACAPLKTGLSEREAQFGKSWTDFVDFLGPSDFLCSHNATNSLQESLPYRFLRNEDHPPLILDMSPSTNEAILLFGMVADAEALSKGKLLTAWKRTMCIPNARAAARSLFSHFSNAAVVVADMWKLIADFAHAPVNPNCTKPRL